MDQIVGIKDIVLILPIIALFVISLLPLTIKLMNNNQEQRSHATLLQGLIGVLFALVFIGIQSSGANVLAFDTAFIFDGINRWLSLLIVTIGGATLFLSHSNINTKGEQFSEHTFLILNAMIGMLILSASSDLIVTFIGLEIMSLALYVLVAQSKEQVIAKEAAFKYFILGSLASAMFLYGIALIYGSSGTTYIPDIAKIAPELLQSDVIFSIGSILLLAGLLFKVSIFPFHAWTPDVYQGAPTPVTAFMSTGVKVATFAFLLRMFSIGMFAENDTVFYIIQWLAVLTILVGNIGAIVQSNLKRMLAYSSVAHSGYVLVGVLVLAANPKDGLSIAAAMYYLLTYVIVNIGAFAIINLFEKSEEKQVTIEDLSGLASERPILSFVFALFMLSLAGIPPLAGFFGKFFIFAAAVQYGFYWVAIWGVLGSVISVYYYLRPVIHMYMKDVDQKIEVMKQELSYIAITICVILILVAGVLSTKFLSTIQAAL
ncbi:MAG: NADH-quinone oxidoreductase subunit N [Bdellovibrionales bacterium]|nr:NADH-quinone oxidoreductase subunit N [Bdellovibrionales bacterium]